MLSPLTLLWVENSNEGEWERERERERERCHSKRISVRKALVFVSILCSYYEVIWMDYRTCNYSFTDYITDTFSFSQKRHWGSFRKCLESLFGRRLEFFHSGGRVEGRRTICRTTSDWSQGTLCCHSRKRPTRLLCWWDGGLQSTRPHTAVQRGVAEMGEEMHHF